MNELDIHGVVELEETDEFGNVLSITTRNAVTYSLRNLMVSHLAGQTAAVPTHIAAGVSEPTFEGQATAATTSTLEDTSKGWLNDSLISKSVEIILGTGTGQTRTITSNSSNTLTISPNWITTPDTTSVYRIKESKDIRTWTRLPREIARKPVEDRRADTDACVILGVFRKNEAGGDWSHLMLVDDDVQEDVLDSCDALDDWDAPGIGSVLTQDTSRRQVGGASLRITINGTGAGTGTFRKDELSFDALSAGYLEDETYLTFWYYISDVSKLSGPLTVELSSSTSDNTDEWQWQLLENSLQTGWNYLALAFRDATEVGSPTLSSIVRFRLVTDYEAVSNGQELNLDNVKLWRPAGNPLAIVDLKPTFTKDADSVLTVRWRLGLTFSGSENTFLWNAQDEEAVIADVTTTLVETGSGTFFSLPGGDPHPWIWPTMWTPATGGYMTAGGNSLSTTRGTILMWSRYNTTSPATDSILLDWRFDADNRITLKRDASGFTLEHEKGGSLSSISQADSFVADDYRLIVSTWDFSGLQISVSDSDDTNASSYSATGTSLSLMGSIPRDATIGGGPSLTSTNMRLGPVLFFTRVLSDTEVNDLFNLNRAFFYKEL